MSADKNLSRVEHFLKKEDGTYRESPEKYDLKDEMIVYYEIYGKGERYKELKENIRKEISENSDNISRWFAYKRLDVDYYEKNKEKMIKFAFFDCDNWNDTCDLTREIYSREGNEPSGRACTDIWRMPAGSNTPQLCCATSLMPRQLAAGFLTIGFGGGRRMQEINNFHQFKIA